jgi:hypothetical protein
MKKIPRERLELVEKLYLSGKSGRAIGSVVCKRFGVSKRTVERYLSLVLNRISALPKPPPEAARARAESLLLSAYQIAKTKRGMSGPDTKSMVAAARTLAEIDGVLSRKIEHSGAIDTTAKVILLPPIEPIDAEPASTVEAEPRSADEVSGEPGE